MFELLDEMVQKTQEEAAAAGLVEGDDDNDEEDEENEDTAEEVEPEEEADAIPELPDRDAEDTYVQELASSEDAVMEMADIPQPEDEEEEEEQDDDDGDMTDVEGVEDPWGTRSMLKVNSTLDGALPGIAKIRASLTSGRHLRFD